MEVADLLPVVERLEDNIDDLEEVLEPLFERSLEETSKKLPLLERAKLNVLLTYTLESLLFSYLRLHGVEAKEHRVFKELERVKQYFIKIKALETEPEKPTMKLDQGAARRFISHGLAGNEQYDAERAEKQAKEKARAHFKATQLAKQLEAESSMSTSSREPSKPSPSSNDSDSEAQSDEFESEDSKTEAPPQLIENNRNTQPTKVLQAAEEFIQLQSESSIKLKSAKAKAKKRAEAAKAKKAKRETSREGLSTDNAGKDSQKEARRKRRGKKKAKRAKQKQQQ